MNALSFTQRQISQCKIRSSVVPGRADVCIGHKQGPRTNRLRPISHFVKVTKVKKKNNLELKLEHKKLKPRLFHRHKYNQPQGQIQD